MTKAEEVYNQIETLITTSELTVGEIVAIINASTRLVNNIKINTFIKKE